VGDNRGRTKDGKAAGRAPWGYCINRVGKGAAYFEIDPTTPEVAPVVIRIFGMARDGKGYGGIAKALAADGLRSPSGKPWTGRCQDNPLERDV